MSDAFEKKLIEYAETFGDGFPTIPLRGWGEEGMIKIIDDCIKKNKNVYDAGYLSLDLDIMY